MLQQSSDIVAKYINSLYAHKIYKHEELLELFKQLESFKDDEKQYLNLRNKIVSANLRLVVSMAKAYKRHKMPFEDLIQEGNSGLIKAVEKFDYKLGHHFSTYARWWIKQAIDQHVLKQKNHIRLPMHAVSAQKKISQFVKQYVELNKTEPVLEDIVAQIGVSEKVTRATIHSSNTVLSLDAEGVNNLYDNASLMTIDPYQTLVSKELFSIIKRVYTTLSFKEASILKLRAGLSLKDDTSIDFAQSTIYRDIAEKMTNDGTRMNHSSIRNYTIKTMVKFIRAFNQEFKLNLQKDQMMTISQSSAFHNVIINNLLDALNIE